MIRSDHRGGRERSEAAVDELLTGFGDWAADRAVDVDLFVVDAALDWRLAGEGDLSVWGAEDIRELLLEWFPRRVTMGRSEWPDVVSTLHHWVDFLATAPAGAGRPHDPAAAHAAIDRHAEEFLGRMADERQYGVAKYWTTRMVEHGVDPEDAEDVRGFLAAVHAGEIDYDPDVLAEIMRRGAFDDELDLLGGGLDEDPVGPLPPVVLPSDRELAALAQDTALVARFRVFVAWVGAGRALTTTGRLRVADARELAGLLGVDQPYLERARSSADLPEVSLVVAWAKAARLVRVVKHRLVPVKSAAGLLDRPLDLWRRAHAVFPELGHAACSPASRYEGPSLVGQVLPEVAPELWLCLYTAGGTPVPVELLVEIVRNALSGRFDFGVGGLLVGIREVLWRRDLAAVLAALETLGAVELTESTDEEERAKIVELSGNEDPDLTLVRLTPLGSWGAREVLLSEGFDAPLVADLRGRPFEQLCDLLRYAGPELTESVLTEWVGARTPTEAAAELAAFCAEGPAPSAHLLAWAGLEHTGAAGTEHARRLRADGGVAGAVATEWLVRHGDLSADAARQHEMSLALAENLAAMHEHGLLVEELARHPLEDQLGFVHALAATDHPDRSDLLATIADQQPATEVTAAARKALGAAAGRSLRVVTGTRAEHR